MKVFYLNSKLVLKFATLFSLVPMTSNPVGTGRKLYVHKTFRRRSGRLLNVLYTFNLRPVSTGNIKIDLKYEMITSFFQNLNNFLRLGNCFMTFRSSRPEAFCKKGVPRNFAKFARKHRFQSLFII